MEVTSPAKQPKRLHRHALPVVMVAVVLLALSAILLGSYNGIGLDSENIISRGLVTRVLQVRPKPNGLAEVTLNNSSLTGVNAGSDLQTGLAQAGGTVQLSLNLQAPSTD
jgi:hypothetical protein